MNLHLTHEQLCDLVLAESALPLEGKLRNDFESTSDVVQAHLRACPVCSAELSSLRDSLSHFRDARSPSARQEFAHSYARRVVDRSSAQLSLAASLLGRGGGGVCRGAVPAQHAPATPDRSSDTATVASVPSQTTESDEALLADIDQKVSSDDVPSPMEPLADPTAGTTTTTSTSDQRTN